MWVSWIKKITKSKNQPARAYLGLSEAYQLDNCHLLSVDIDDSPFTNFQELQHGYQWMQDWIPLEEDGACYLEVGLRIIDFRPYECQSHIHSIEHVPSFGEAAFLLLILFLYIICDDYESFTMAFLHPNHMTLT